MDDEPVPGDAEVAPGIGRQWGDSVSSALRKQTVSGRAASASIASDSLARARPASPRDVRARSGPSQFSSRAAAFRFLARSGW